MVLWAKSYPRERIFLFVFFPRLSPERTGDSYDCHRGSCLKSKCTNQSRRSRCRRSGTVEPPSVRRRTWRAASHCEGWCTPGGSWVGGLRRALKRDRKKNRNEAVVKSLSYVWQTNAEATTVFIKRKPLSKRFVKLTGAQKGGGGEINGVSSDFGEGCESHLEVLHHSAINPTWRPRRQMLNGLFMAVTPRCVWDNRLRRGGRSKSKVELGGTSSDGFLRPPYRCAIRPKFH